MKKIKVTAWFILVFTFLLISTYSSGQMRNSVLSPEVLDGNKITFRLFAPESDTVFLYGEWIKDYTSLDLMVKNDTGLWELTVFLTYEHQLS